MPFTGDEEYKAKSSGKILTLVDGDFTLGDSKVICRYLEALSRGAGLPYYASRQSHGGLV